jgi:hypothetical protein
MILLTEMRVVSLSWKCVHLPFVPSSAIERLISTSFLPAQKSLLPDETPRELHGGRALRNYTEGGTWSGFPAWIATKEPHMLSQGVNQRHMFEERVVWNARLRRHLSSSLGLVPQGARCYAIVCVLEVSGRAIGSDVAQSCHRSTSEVMEATRWLK